MRCHAAAHSVRGIVFRQGTAFPQFASQPGREAVPQSVITSGVLTPEGIVDGALQAMFVKS